VSKTEREQGVKVTRNNISPVDQHACEAGDRQAADRFTNGSASQDDKNRYSGGW
jgi:hypothetical protein